MSAATPLKSERLIVVDALRGFALMGLFIVHAVEYFELYWYKPAPGIIHDTVFFLLGGKMAATFAVLFGVAVHTMLDRYQQRDVDFRGRLIWRFALLIGLGYLHGLLYAGDILLHLGIIGMFLVAVCRLSSFGLMLIAAFCFFQVPTLVDFVATFFDPKSAEAKPLFWALSWRNFEVFASAPLLDLIQYNALRAYENKWVFNFETGKFWPMAGYAISGVVLGRIQFFSRAANAKPSLQVLLVAALMIAVLLCGLKIVGSTQLPEGMSRWYFSEIVGNVFNTAAVAVGICFFMLAYRFAFVCRLQNLFAPCGRMSLTLYVGQSLVCVPIFYGFGLAWYAEVTQLQALVFGFVGCALQMAFARYWFKGFAYGPLEWAWRALTLLSADIPFKKR
ncbi:MAG TPA: DUF418 domain-containing protein [Marinagarivorans sp.]